MMNDELRMMNTEVRENSGEQAIHLLSFILHN